MSSYSGVAPTSTAPSRKPLYEPDEIVVALPYERLVQARLAEWRAQPQCNSPDDLSPRLGLVRLHLQTVAAHDYLREHARRWVRMARKEAKAAARPAAPLDIVLRCLRYSFAEEYSGWVPTFGKNRVMQRLNGSYVIDGAGQSGPQPVKHYVLSGNGPVNPPYRTLELRGSTPGSGTRIGLIDTPLYPHPWLAGAYIASANSLQDRAADNQSALRHHATFVTGLLLRQAPGAVIDVRVALDPQPGAEARNDTWNLAKVIADMAESKVDVLNLSLGCTTEDGEAPMVLNAAIAALGPETLVVAAAGNHATRQQGTPQPVFPAALDNVVAVGALDGREQASFSPRTAWVDALAPGVNVASTCDPDQDGGAVLATWSGTSFAAAIASGAVAARTREFGSAPRAWSRMRDELGQCDGKPVVPLSRSDWP